MVIGRVGSLNEQMKVESWLSWENEGNPASPPACPWVLGLESWALGPRIRKILRFLAAIASWTVVECRRSMPRKIARLGLGWNWGLLIVMGGLEGREGLPIHHLST